MKIDSRRNIYAFLHRHGVDYEVKICPKRNTIQWFVDGELYDTDSIVRVQTLEAKKR